MREKVGVRVAVALTGLLCLWTAGYAGHVWWARRIAEDDDYRYQVGIRIHWGDYEYFIDRWRTCPWYGCDSEYQVGWITRRVYFESLKSVTRQDFPNNPDVWEAWFKVHPNLHWDDKRKGLVDGEPLVVRP